MAMLGLLNLPLDPIGQGDPGYEFKLEPGIVLISAIGLNVAETVNIEMYVGNNGGNALWVPALDPVLGENTPQLTDTAPFHFVFGGVRMRAYKSTTGSPIALKGQHVATMLVGNK